MTRNEQSREASLGRHAAAPRRRAVEGSAKRPRRGVFAAVAAIALVGALAVGGTIAWLTDGTGPVENTFTPSRVTTTIEEKTDEGVKSDVSVKNTGDVPVYIRAKVVVSWVKTVDGKQEVSSQVPVKDEDYEITLQTVSFGNLDSSGSTNQWIVGDDGFYYHAPSIAPDALTGVLVTSAKQLSGASVPEGYKLSVEILSEAIQSLPDGAFNDSWSESSGLTAANGTLSVKLATDASASSGN